MGVRVDRGSQAEVLVPRLIELSADAWVQEDPNIIFRFLLDLQADGWTLNEVLTLLVTALARSAGEKWRV
jgi:hypothetical protein